MSSTPKTIQIFRPSAEPHGIRIAAGRLPSPSLRVIPIRLVSHHRSGYASSPGGVRDAQRQRPQVPSHRVGKQAQMESPSGTFFACALMPASRLGDRRGREPLPLQPQQQNVHQARVLWLRSRQLRQEAHALREQQSVRVSPQSLARFGKHVFSGV